MKYEIICFILLCSFLSCKAQQPFGTEHLKQESVIALPGVKGRLDHMAVNLKDQVVYVAALGSNSVEVIDLQKGTTVHHIKGLDAPQGIAYIPAHNEIAVANGGTGDCVFFDALSFKKVATIHLAADADNVRYDAAAGRVYVGYGDGGIAVIDIASHQLVGEVKLAAHPESFQLDTRSNLLFVNLPDAQRIAVISLKDLKVVNQWKTNKFNANFPMALDTPNNQLFVGYRNPAALVAYDSKTGQEKFHTDLVSDVDDVFYDAVTQQVYASGGGGAINIFTKEGNAYKKVANIPTRSGARTSLLIPSLQTFILAERAEGGQEAAIIVYKIKD